MNEVSARGRMHLRCFRRQAQELFLQPVPLQLQRRSLRVRNELRIELELALSDHNADLLRRDADIAVRMARPTQQALVARRIGIVEIGLFAHREYVQAFGLPRTLEDLSAHRLIGFDRDPHAIRTAGGSAGSAVLLQPYTVYRYSDSSDYRGTNCAFLSGIAIFPAYAVLF